MNMAFERASLRGAWVVLSWLAMAWPAMAEPLPKTEPSSGAALLDAAADTTIQRLPTCENTIRMRVSEWKASAAIACKKSAGGREAACADAQLKARADRLKRLRSCRFF